MNSKTLKATGAVVLACLVMIIIVIYTPKPEPSSSRRRPSFKAVNTEYLELANQANKKTNKMNGIAHHQSLHFAKGEKIDFTPLTIANTAAIDALAEADKSSKQCNEELQKFQEETSLTILIEANTKLIASLSEMSKAVKALDGEFQRLERENIQPSPPSVKKITDAIEKVSNATDKGIHALGETIKAFREYYELGP